MEKWVLNPWRRRPKSCKHGRTACPALNFGTVLNWKVLLTCCELNNAHWQTIFDSPFTGYLGGWLLD